MKKLLTNKKFLIASVITAAALALILVQKKLPQPLIEIDGEISV